MKRRQKGKLSLSKRPNDQKLIETFLLLNQSKTEGKNNENKLTSTNLPPRLPLSSTNKLNNLNSTKLSDDNKEKIIIDKKENVSIKSKELQNMDNKIEKIEIIEEKNDEKNIGKEEIEFIQRQNELRLINRGMFFDQDNKKLIEEVKNTNPELYKRISAVEEEMIFPIMIDTTLGVYKELVSSKIEEIFKKITKNEEKTWIEVLPIIDVGIVKLKVKDPDNEDNFIILGFITKAISYQLYLLSLNNIISIKIYAHKNGRRLAIFVGLNYLKYSIKVIFTDEKEKFYKLHFKSDLVLGNDIYKILKDLKNKYTPLNIYKQEFLSIIYDLKGENITKNNKKKDNENNDDSTMDDESSSNSFEKQRNLADYLVNNVEKILSITISYDNLFNENDKKYYSIFMDLNQQEKTTLLKFLRRKNKWQNINKLFSNENNDINNEIIENIDIIILSLLEKKLISNFREIVGDFQDMNSNKLFEYLYYLSMEDLRAINSDLSKLCKNLNGKQTKQNLSPYVKESFINNPFYNLYTFISTDEENDTFFKNIINKTSEKITKFNFSEENISKAKLKKEVGFNPILMNTKANKNANYNNQYINTFLNYSNFKSIHLSTNLITGNKIYLIYDIISQINIYLKEKSSLFIENFVQINGSKNNNLINSKQKNIEKIFEKYNRILFCINENFARVMDITSRLFFFYTDCKDLNDIGKEFYEIERYESYNYSCSDNNKIFKDKKIFNLYDTLYQIKNSYLIFSMFNSNEMKNPLFFYEILQPLIPFLIQVTNKALFDKFLSKKNGINFENLTDDIIEKLTEKLTKNLQLSFNPSDDDFFNGGKNDMNQIKNNGIHIHFNEISFLDKYRPEYISSQMLYYYILNLERNKKFKLANLIYIFLLNCFDNSFILKQRGFIYYRIILNYSFHLKSNKEAIEILNICIKYDIMQYKIIKSGDLFKIKKHYDKLSKLKNNTKNKGKNKILNLLIPYSFKEINNNDFDIKKILKEIEADSLYSVNSGRRKYNLSEGKFSETATVEEFALNYYLKEENLKGVHGENLVIPALYTLLLWEEIFDDKTPLVFQSKFQAFPLDFYEKDFYLNRKEIVDSKLEKIKNYKKEQFIKHIQIIYDTKNGIKNPCVEWNSYVYNRDILIKIAVAFGPQKLTEIFKVILIQGLKHVKTGMPDLFLWSEKSKTKYKEQNFYAEIDSIKLVEVKSINDKLSDNQKFWLKTFYDNNINVEVLHIK